MEYDQGPGREGRGGDIGQCGWAWKERSVMVCSEPYLLYQPLMHWLDKLILASGGMHLDLISLGRRSTGIECLVKPCVVQRVLQTQTAGSSCFEPTGCVLCSMHDGCNNCGMLWRELAIAISYCVQCHVSEPISAAVQHHFAMHLYGCTSRRTPCGSAPAARIQHQQNDCTLTYASVSPPTQVAVLHSCV